MSNKDALSQFQSRLTERLNAAGAEDAKSAANWLAVEISGQGFVLPLNQAGEIFPWSDPQPIPYVKEWFLGVSNLRGALCGVVSLSMYLGLMPSLHQTSGGSPNLQDRRLVGFHPSLELNTVIVVDKLIGLKSQSQMTQTLVTNQYQDVDGKTWIEIDLELLSQNNAFISIAQK